MAPREFARNVGRDGGHAERLCWAALANSRDSRSASSQQLDRTVWGMIRQVKSRAAVFADQMLPDH
jgi:hypothetical protein